MRGFFVSLTLGLFLVGFWLVPSARALNECGSSASERYALHSSSPSTPYSEGDIVRTGTGSAKKLWRAGSTVSGTPGATGASGWTDVTAIYATLSITCSSSTSGLSTTTSVRYNTPTDLALIYDRSGTVKQLRHLIRKGEVAILQGTIAMTDNNYAVLVGQFAPRQTVRFTMASGTTITNTNTGVGAGGVYLQGGGSLFFDSAGDISAAGAARLVNVYTGGGSGASIDVNITGGVLKATGSSAVVLNAETNAGGSGTIDVDITGATTRLWASASNADSVIRIVSDSLTGTSSLKIGAGVIVCRGTLSAGDVCSQNSGRAIFVDLDGVGAATLTNAGTVFGDIVVDPTAATINITNQATGVIVGRYDSQGTQSNRNSVLTNAGTWTISSSFQFGGTTDSDSFTNSGTFIVRHAGSTLAMNNLETFTLSSGGTLRFSLASNSIPSHALLSIGGATPTFAGTINLLARDSSAIPTTGSVILVSGTNIPDATSTSGLTVTGAAGTFRIASNQLILDLTPPPTTTCGTAAARTATSPGVADMQTICDSTDSLTTASRISVTAAKIAILYRGTASGGSGNVLSISNTGAGGEIHIESGGVARTTAGDAVSLSNAGTDALRFVLASGATVSNTDTTATSDAIVVSGGGAVSLTVAGNISATAGVAISATAGGSGTLDLDITGGTHTGSSNVLSASIASGGTGALDVDITGGVLYGGSSSAAVIALSGTGGADTLDIGSGVVVCRGSYSASSCTVASGTAVSLAKTGTQAGSITVTNTGSIWGGISTSTTVASTITNQAGGAIVGAFTGSAGNDALSNAGTWTMSSNFDFAGGTDSFANSGTFIVRYAGTTLAMNNLETFTLSSGGTLQFSLASNTLPTVALLNVGGATPTFAGTVSFAVRDSTTLPTSGSITLLSATSLPDGTSTSGLTLTGVTGAFRIASNQLILDLARAAVSTTCGNTTTRTPVSPGVADVEAVCDSADSLTAASDISVTADKVAIIYRGTQSGGSGNVRSISNTGESGEIHIESGGVARTTAGTAVDLNDTEGADALRLVTASGTSISNTHTGSLSHAIYVGVTGSISTSLAGSTSAAGGVGIFLSGASVDLDITGGTHTSPRRVVAVNSRGGTGALDVDITGGILHGGSSTNAVIALEGSRGVDTLDIGSGVVVCRGSYSAGSCTAGSGDAVSLRRGVIQAGTTTFRNSGSVWGDITASQLTIGSTITNQTGGAIVGAFTGGTGNDVLSNAGTWTLSSNFDFGTSSGDADSFTNSGTFIVHYAGTTLAMNNLETFTLNSAGTLRFSLASNSIPSHALLSIGGATPTFAGTINLVARDSSAIPTTGSIVLIAGTSIPDATSTSGLTLTGASGAFRIASNQLILDLAAPTSTTCGTVTARTATSPGVANMQVVCDSTDTLTAASNISVSAAKIAIIYRGTQAGGTGNVNSISNTGAGGEIHIESGGVARNTRGHAVTLSNAGGDALRFVLAAGASIENLDTNSTSIGVYVGGRSDMILEIAGDTSTAGGTAIYTDSRANTGSIDLDITGGTHVSGGGWSTVTANLLSAGTGAIDISITGAETRLSLSRSASSGAVIDVGGKRGTDRVFVGAGVRVCRGTFNAAGACDYSNQGNNNAIILGKYISVGGSLTLINEGHIWGDIVVHARSVGASVTNRGFVRGNFEADSSATGGNTVTNTGSWIFTGNSDFRGGADSFTNSGILVAEHSGSTLTFNNLETFTLQEGGVFRVSLASNTLPTHAILALGAATPTLAGIVDLEIRDSSALPTSGTLNLITGTAITGSTIIDNLLLGGGLVGTFGISGNTLTVTFAEAASCGISSTPREVQSPGVADREILCDVEDNLTSESRISTAVSRLAVVFRGTAADGSGSVRTITHTGAGGEIHIFGSVLTPRAPGVFTSVALRSTPGTQPLRVVLGAGASIENLDVNSASRGIFVNGAGDVFVQSAGDISTAGGQAIIAASAAAMGSVDIDITGGDVRTVRTASVVSSGAVRGSLIGSGTGAVDISITGADTRVSYARNFTGLVATVSLWGAGGADRLFVGPGAKVCRGIFNDDGNCNQSNQGSGYVVYFFKAATSGSSTLINEGSIWGDILAFSSATISVTNRGFIRGNFVSRTDTSADTILNEGSWILTGDSFFRAGTDSFTSSGMLVAEHSGSTLTLSDLETFTLQDGGLIKISLASNSLPSHAILTLGGATPTLAGIVDLELRDSGTLPTSGSVTLFTGTGISGSTSLSNLRVHSRIGGTFSRSGNDIILTFAAAPAAVANTTCGSSVVRDVVLPGNADKAIICSSADTVSSDTDLSVTAAQVAVIYEEDTAGSGSIRTITNSGSGAEVHILGGTVTNPNRATADIAVDMQTGTSGTLPVRFVLAEGASVINQETAAGGSGIVMTGAAHLYVDVAGSISTAGTGNADGMLVWGRGDTSNVYINIAGGTHSAAGRAMVHASLYDASSTASEHTGLIEINVLGDGTSVAANSGTVLYTNGRTGDDSITIGAGALVCRGTVSSGVCTQSSGSAIHMQKQVAVGGSMTVTNAGRIVGDITIQGGAVAGTVTNSASGVIRGNFLAAAATTGGDTVTNAGFWTITGTNEFRGGTDSFTNSGVFVVERASASPSTIAMNGLDAFTLDPEGILLFSVPNNNAITGALLNIGGAADTFAGIIDVVTRDNTALPTSGSYTLIAGTAIAAGAHSNLRLAGHIGGTLSTSTTNIVLTFEAAPTNICGSPGARVVVPPGNANMEVVCDAADDLTFNSAVSNSTARVAILYRGIPNNPARTVKSISNTGAGGEIHILSGSVESPDDGGNGTVDTVRLVNLTSMDPLRVVVASGASVTNRDITSSSSSAIEVAGGRSVSVSVAGDTYAAGAQAIHAQAAGSGNVDLDITGGTHASLLRNTVYASISTGGTGALDVDITGGVLHRGGTTNVNAVIWLQGIGGADTLDIGRGAVVCRGIYSAGSCAAGSGFGVYLSKHGTAAGSMTVTNAGRIWGNVSVSGAGAPTTVTNQASGVIVGTFAGGGALDTVTNAGTWTLNGDSNFGVGVDSFTNSGTLIVHYAGAALAMRNLASFTLTSTSVLRFSLATTTPSTALLDLGIAAPTLAGEVQLVLRDDTLSFPTTGSITLLTSSGLGTPDLSNLNLHTDISGYLSVSGNNLQVTFEVPPTSTACGDGVRRAVTAPGIARWNIVCDSDDTGLTTSSDISITDNRIALIYRGTQAGGTGAINSISNTGAKAVRFI